MAANLPLDGRWNFPNTLCLAPKHTGAELALRQPEKRIKDFGQSYRHFVTGLHYFCPTMQYIMYLLKKLKKEKKMYLLLCEIFYYNSMWSYFSVGPLYHYRQCR